MMPRITLRRAVQVLERHYGRPKVARLRDPWSLIVWENVAYLADADRRQAAFELLQQTAGTEPQQIAQADLTALLPVTRHGILSEQIAAKLRRCAQIAVEEFDGDLRQVLKLPIVQAKKALQKFPGIGEPGAEKILLYTKTAPLLALDSNGLRAIVRLGFAAEQKSYSATYRMVREKLADKLPKDCDWLMRAHLLLERHGMELCKRSQPLCSQCPLMRQCAFAAAMGIH